MVILNFLRILADLGFYYAFAGTLSGFFGGAFSLAGMLLQSVCFAVSAGFQKRKWARLLTLAPTLLFFFLPSLALADQLVYLSALLYILYLAWTGDDTLSRERQADLFSIFWKVFLVFALFFSLAGGWQMILSIGLPIALIMVTASVLLMRSIRHDPEVYLQKTYQMINVASVAVLILVACLASTKWFLNGISSFIHAIYELVVAPVLIGIAMLVGYLCMLFVTLLQRLLALIKGDNAPATLPESGMPQLREQLEGTYSDTSSPFIFRIILALAILAGILLVFLFFRWLARQRNDRAKEPAVTELRIDHPEPAKQAKQIFGTSYVYRIRSQYRSFLKLCRKNGIEISRSDTSTEVNWKAAARLQQEECLEAFLLLYQKARYHNEASREDYVQAKALYARISKMLRS